MYQCLLISLAVYASPAFGQLGPLIYSQAPNRSFGLVSDTSFTNDFGQPDAALRADRFTLSTGATIGQIVWFGHYGTQNQDIDPDPPTTESFRIRVYSQVTSPIPILQLPADVLYEANADDVFRQFNDAFVNGRREYRYVLDLPSMFWAQSGIPYWLEISQIGDVSSAWRWETANGGEYASQYPIGSPWSLNSFGFQTAYQLRVPEPITGSFVALVLLTGAMHRSSRLR